MGLTAESAFAYTQAPAETAQSFPLMHREYLLKRQRRIRLHRLYSHLYKFSPSDMYFKFTILISARSQVQLPEAFFSLGACSATGCALGETL